MHESFRNLRQVPLEVAAQARVVIEDEHDGAFLEAPLIIIVRFPKTRVDGESVESTDVFVFLTHQSVRGDATMEHTIHGAVEKQLRASAVAPTLIHQASLKGARSCRSCARSIVPIVRPASPARRKRPPSPNASWVIGNDR